MNPLKYLRTLFHDVITSLGYAKYEKVERGGETRYTRLIDETYDPIDRVEVKYWWVLNTLYSGWGGKSEWRKWKKRSARKHWCIITKTYLKDGRAFHRTYTSTDTMFFYNLKMIPHRAVTDTLRVLIALEDDKRHPGQVQSLRNASLS